MEKMLFTHSYFLALDPKQKKAGNAYPPLGTLYAAAMMRERGYEVSLFDSMLAAGPHLLEEQLRRFHPAYLVIYDDGFNYLTKMCLTNMRQAAFNMAQMAKSYGCKVIVCSSDSTDHAAAYLEHGADYVILGEGELTLQDLVEKLAEGQAINEIPGLVYKDNETITSTGRRNVIRDLDQLPLPAWDLVDFDAYRQLWKKKHGYFSLNIAASRGCTFKCNWCAKPLYGNRYHARSPEAVARELQLLVKEQGAGHIWFCDDIFGLKPGWVRQFAEAVEKQGLDFRFKIQSRADLLLEEDTVHWLAKAGCEEVWIGAESGSQKVLDAMDKGTTTEQIYRCRKLLAKHGIRAAFFLQFGYPGETREDIDATVKMVMDLMPDDIGISVTYPLPGTKLFERVSAELKDKSNWRHSDELAMMFRNTYPQHYYKMLQRYVHIRYREKQGYDLIRTTLRHPRSLQAGQLPKAAKAVYFSILRMIKQRELSKFHLAYESGI